MRYKVEWRGCNGSRQAFVGERIFGTPKSAGQFAARVDGRIYQQVNGAWEPISRQRLKRETHDTTD